MKKTARIFYALFAIIALSGCASAMKDEVLARSDSLSSRPNWVSEEKTFTIEKGTVYMMGIHEMPVVGKRITTGYRVAENNAKAGLSGAIEQKLNFIFQNAEEGDEMGADQTRFIGGETSKLVASSIRPANRYWEKVSRVVDADGNRDVIYRIFVRVSMPEADFKKAIQEAIKRNSGKKGISEDFAKKVEAHWDQMGE
ncbi:MAG: hypothetical protein J5716_03635 [Alphaproteobacteria bacterium]|nr:hypothetical protein [Alphaproteobacteria bacterium]